MASLHSPAPLPLRGSKSLTVPSSYIRITDVLSLPAHPHLLTRLHLCPCHCKCKTFLLPNFPLTSQDLLFLDTTPFGCKIAAASATMLGLFLHSPFTSILPDASPAPRPPSLFNSLELEQQQLNKAFATMEKRIRTASPLQLSFRDRTLYLSFYVLSLPHYHHSTLLPTSPLLDRYTSLIRKFLCRRHWIQAQHLPGIVTFLKLGILHCPKIFLYSSLLGFAIRRFGEPLVAWLCGVSHSLPSLPAQIETGLRSIRSLLSDALPFHSEPYSVPIQAHLFQQISPYKLSHLVTKHFKNFLRRKLNFEARDFLLQRFANVKWHFVASPQLFDMLHTTPLKIIPAAAASRLAILRWAIDSDPDFHFRLRPHLTRHTPCRCGCGRLSSLYPEGLSRGSVCSSHLIPHLTWTLFLPSDLPPPLSHLAFPPPPLPLPEHVQFLSRKPESHSTLNFLPRPLQLWASQTCVLCGCGDNSVQHWLYFCPVPALAGSLLLRTPWKTSHWFLQETFSASRLAVVAGLWVSARQFIHERSGLPPPSMDLPPFISLIAPFLIPPAYRPTHLHSPTPARSFSSCFFEHFTFRLRSYESEAVPIFHGPAPVLDNDITAETRISTLSPHSPTLRKLFLFQKRLPRRPNCALTFGLCACGHIHAHLHALQPLSANTPLHVGDPPYHESDFVLQFDRGAYRTLGIGGAGVVLWQHTRGSLVFIDSRCLPLYPCPDAAHAEAAGAAAAVLLAAKHYPTLRPTRILIKGDNRAVIDFMTHTGKYRRPDLQQALQEAHHLLAFRLPPCTWCYTPREFNKCADFLAGIARDHAREQLSSLDTPPLPLEPFFFPLPPSLATTFAPTPPLSMSSTASSFTFPELSSFSPALLPLLFRSYHNSPRILRYLRTLSRSQTACSSARPVPSPIQIAYQPSAEDGLGRLYPHPLGAASLPRELRLLLFGSSHTEIDLVSAHYQIFRRAALTYLSIALPTAPQLREALRRDMSLPPCTILTHFPQAHKRTPLLLLNSNLGNTLQYLAAYGYYPSFEVRHYLRSINAAKEPLLARLEHENGVRTLRTSGPRNCCFFLLEHLESFWMKLFVSHLLQHFIPDSLIWLHDGIWISPSPPHDLISTANRLATTHSRFSADPLLLSCTSLKPSYQDVVSRTLGGLPPPPQDPFVLFRPPRQILAPPLAETDAKRAFVRMMARQATAPLTSVASIRPRPAAGLPDEIIEID